MGWWWVTNRSGWLLELLTELINEFWAEHYFWTQIRKEISQDEIRSEESAHRERTIKFTISRPSLHYGNIFEYLSLWSEVQFLNIQKSKKKSKKSKNLTNLDFIPETCQKIEKMLILN